MKLDGYDIKIGDHVYDVVLGAGVVVSLHEDNVNPRFTVRFGAHRLLTYNTKGFNHYKHRTLFWKNPLIVIPSKEDKAWEMQKEICIVATQIIQAKAQVIYAQK